nr:DUF3761 domain-containing protein [Caballeronia ptereochthonis]
MRTRQRSDARSITTTREQEDEETSADARLCGRVAHSSAHSGSGAVPQGATAQRRDGTYSFSQHHSGTCSRHGGMAQWIWVRRILE